MKDSLCDLYILEHLGSIFFSYELVHKLKKQRIVFKAVGTYF